MNAENIRANNKKNYDSRMENNNRLTFDIPKDMHKRLKFAALKEEMPIRVLMLNLLDKYLTENEY